jgi:hypothetical protein
VDHVGGGERLARRSDPGAARAARRRGRADRGSERGARCQGRANRGAGSRAGDPRRADRGARGSGRGAGQAGRGATGEARPQLAKLAPAAVERSTGLARGQGQEERSQARRATGTWRGHAQAGATRGGRRGQKPVPEGMPELLVGVARSARSGRDAIPADGALAAGEAARQGVAVQRGELPPLRLPDACSVRQGPNPRLAVRSAAEWPRRRRSAATTT